MGLNANLHLRKTNVAVVILMKTKIEVEIFKVKTDEYYYSFEYKIFVNSELKAEGKYDGDHSWGKDHKGWRKQLQNGYAVKYAIEQSL